jgi:predicted alpha-1,6-mannanase (GH76 family)
MMPLFENRMRTAKWRNGKREITGRWEYLWAAQRFVIVLDATDRTTGQQKRFVVSGDTPEWGNWRLVKEEKNAAASSGDDRG